MKTFSRVREGSALFTALTIVFSLSALLAVCLTFSLQRSFSARRLNDRIRSVAIAEAGANEAYALLSTNFNLVSNAAAFPPTPHGGGSYDATVMLVTNDVAVIESQGVFGSVTSTVMMDIKNYADLPTLLTIAPVFKYTMVCGGELVFRGCGLIEGGPADPRVHANQRISIYGDAQANVSFESSSQIDVKNVTVNGSITAPVLNVHDAGTVTGASNTKPVTPVEIPDIDLTPYYKWANANHEVYNGLTLTNGVHSPNGGVIWVNGDASIGGDATINGTVVATGEIHLSGTVNLSPTLCLLALATRDGPRITNQSSGTINGLIYVRNGDYDHTANGNVFGQVVVKHNIKKAGTSDHMLYTKSIPVPPGTPPPPVSVVGVTAWQK